MQRQDLQVNASAQQDPEIQIASISLHPMQVVAAIMGLK